jgi:hypothetical protein
MKNLYLVPFGEDCFGRPVYLSQNGNAIVDIDRRDPRKDLRTKWPPKDAYYGEPDCHLDPDLKPVFVDESLVEEANQCLEQAGSRVRYLIKKDNAGTHFFRNNDVEAGDDIDVLYPLPFLRYIIQVLEEEHA